MTKVNVNFRLRGNLLPIDLGERLLYPISQVIPGFHTEEDAGILPIFSRPTGKGCIEITENSFLTIRLSLEHAGRLFPLTGQTLRLGEHKVRVGAPQTIYLRPSPSLFCNMVVIEGFLEPAPFLNAVRAQLDAMDILGRTSLAPSFTVRVQQDERNGKRSANVISKVRVRGSEILGFALRVRELTSRESIRLQENGLGSFRLFGCGIFTPERR